jgi:PAS domain S-box-containing protein
MVSGETPARSDSLRASIEQEHARILARLFGPSSGELTDPRLAAHYLALARSIAALPRPKLLGLRLLPELPSEGGTLTGPDAAEVETAQAAEELVLFRRVADASGHGFAVADARGELSYANPILCRMYGETTPASVVGQSMMTYLPEGWHDAFQTEILLAVLREGRWVGELPVRARSGALTPAIQTIFVVHHSRSGAVHIAALVLDITERKRTEVALRESEARFRELVETVDEVIFAVDPGGFISYISPSIQRLSGYTPADVLRQPVWRFMHVDDRVVLLERVQRLERGEPLEPHEYRAIRKDGAVRWVRISSRPIWRDGRVCELRGTMVDIHARKEAEEALRESEAKYVALVEQARIGVAIVQDGLIQYCNQYCAGLIGYLPEEVMGRPLAEYIDPEDRQTQTDIHERRMRGETAPTRYRTVGRHRDGTAVRVENAVALIQYRGRPAALVVVRDLGHADQE